MTITLLAPAKLNLFLHVTGCRFDGYHELQTVFQLLDYGDTVRVTVHDEGGISLVSPLPGVPPSEDLCLRAATALCTRAKRQFPGRRFGALIDVDKRIPLGGGLGGGSANAAAVLSALNSGWKLGLSDDDLAAIGIGLGADVPVFVRRESAWAEGIGERLTPIRIPPRWYVVATPSVEVSTRSVFNDESLTRDSAKLKIQDFARDGVESAQQVPGGGLARPLIDFDGLMARTRNDCQDVVFRRYPQVASACETLGRAGRCRMTGTGASVFAWFGSREEAERTASALQPGLSCFVARGIDRLRAV